MEIDPYAVLGVRATATADEIRRAYLRQVRIHHPDARPAICRQSSSPMSHFDGSWRPTTCFATLSAGHATTAHKQVPTLSPSTGHVLRVYRRKPRVDRS
ncbi:J domain-containing protein [Mycobacterium sp. OAS707]|uniref:J domain-containing protein n=1 Tax=Mycobacterium sp. OAS707 TaxID=2663822 RepID=UPI00178B9BC3